MYKLRLLSEPLGYLYQKKERENGRDVGEIWSVKLAKPKEVHLGVIWMKVRAERIVKDERVEERTLEWRAPPPLDSPSLV